MKKSLVLFIFLLLIANIFIITSIYAQDDSSQPPLPPSSDNAQSSNDNSAGLESTIEGAAGKVEDTVEDLESTNAEDIKKSLKEKLLENPFISSLDSFFKKINIVFKFLFALDYSLSWILFFVIISWIIILMTGTNLSKIFVPKLKNISILIGLASAIIFAQAGIYISIINFFNKFLFTQENKWIRVAFFVILGILILFIISLQIFIYEKLKELRKKQKQNKAEQAKEKLVKFSEGFETSSKE